MSVCSLAFYIRSRSLPVVSLVRLTKGSAVQAVYATGTVEPEIMLPVATRGAARLFELKVDEGANVTKGELLARLENDDLKSSLAVVQAKESFAKSEYERKSTLVKQGAISRQDFAKAESDWEAAKAETARAEAMMEFMDLSAPADGKIIRRDGEIGQLIPANQPVFWLSVASPLRITAEVDEEDIALVKPDQAVAIRADAFPGEVFRGAVKSITPKGDPIARSYRVRIQIDGKTPLQIGMTAETNIIISEKENTWLLPTSAVKDGSVWILRGSRITRVPVTLGTAGADRVEILSGLTPEVDVVLESSDKFKDGTAVRVTTAPAE